MSTPTLNNGLFIRDIDYKVTPHLDSYHMRNILQDTKPMDLGPIELWASLQKVEMPLYQLSNFGGKNTILVDNPSGEYKWQIPIINDIPYIVEDVEPSNDNLGADELPFKIKINKRAFGHGDIITYDKMNGAELYVTAEDILPATDGYIYTVQLVNKGTTDTLNKRFLDPGTRYFVVTSAKSEHGQKWSDIGELNNGFREYYNFVGGATANASYSISNQAELIARGGMKADGTVPAMEIWRTFDMSLDPSVASINDVAKQLGETLTKKAVENGNLSRTFITKLEAASLTKVARDIESYLMWGKGGRISTQDGPDDMRMSVGLWKQLDNSFKRVYNKSSFSLELFRSELYNFYHGKVEFEGPNPQRQIVVQTGMAGMKLVNEAIKRELNNDSVGMTANRMEIGPNGIKAVTGDAMSLKFGYAFTGYTIPFLANVSFVINPAFDPVNNNDIENPIIDGFPLSSYSFIVFDITDNTNDNICLLKKKWDSNLRWFYENGTMDYMGRTSGFQSSGSFSGYRVKMEQAHNAIFVKDPTKVLKVCMRNPITGGSL